jgi:hypothetical protein
MGVPPLLGSSANMPEDSRTFPHLGHQPLPFPAQTVLIAARKLEPDGRPA